MDRLTNTRLLIGLVLLGLLTGCGAAPGGGSADASAQSSVAKADVIIDSVSLSGAVPVASGVTTVTVGGRPATVSGQQWTAIVPYAKGSTVPIVVAMNGTVIAQYETTMP